MWQNSAEFNGVHWQVAELAAAQLTGTDNRRSAAAGFVAADVLVPALKQIPTVLVLVVAQVWAAEGGWANWAL